MPQIPLIANPGAGTTAAALDVLCGEPRCELRRVPGEKVAAEVRAAAAAGAERIVVAGGDGTVAAAMAGLEGSQAVLGVVPAGTLNHFAHDLQLPMEAAEALRVALEGTPTPVDLGSVNGRRFLNTSAVGA